MENRNSYKGIICPDLQVGDQKNSGNRDASIASQRKLK
jgi:hypothetical protein